MRGAAADKADVVPRDRPVCFTETFFGKAFSSVLQFCATSAARPNQAVMFDLMEGDPTPYLNMSVAKLRAAMRRTRPRKVFRAVPLNQSPIVLDVSHAAALPEYGEPALLQQHAALIAQAPRTFHERVQRAWDAESEAQQKKRAQAASRKRKRLATRLHAKVPEESLYDAFVAPADQQRLDAFHGDGGGADWEARARQCSEFDDARLRYFGQRLVYDECPDALPQAAHDSISRELAARLLPQHSDSASSVEMKWLTIPQAMHQTNSLLDKLVNGRAPASASDEAEAAQQRVVLEELQVHYDAMQQHWSRYL
jgi:hypothetical protein